MSWETIAVLLGRWHEARDRNSLRLGVEFLERELRLMVPPIVRRRWPEDLIEDALQGFLGKLIEKPLTTELASPKAFFARAFRNHCIDLHEQRSRQPDAKSVDIMELDESLPDTREGADQALQSQERARHVREALDGLSLSDRVALKLELAPQWLTEAEMAWLAERTGRPEEAVRGALSDAPDMYAVSKIFDPGDDAPDDLDARRHRMERFRRRRDRAREKLRSLLTEVT